MVYENFSFFDRHIPGAHIRRKLICFERVVMEFSKDTWVSMCPLLEPSFLNFLQKTTEPGDRSIDWAMILNGMLSLVALLNHSTYVTLISQ